MNLNILTPRQREIFDLLGQGLDKRHIADRFGLAIKTIETHREEIKKRLGIGSIRELVNYAVQVKIGILSSRTGARRRPRCESSGAGGVEAQQYAIGASHSAEWITREAHRLAASGKHLDEILKHLGYCDRVVLEWREANGRDNAPAFVPAGDPWDWTADELGSYIEEHKSQW